MPPFNPSSPMSGAAGRHGELIITQGTGRPQRLVIPGSPVDAGMDAPTTAAAVTLDPIPKYYVARMDVSKPGACYYSAPKVTFTVDTPTQTSGAPIRVAQATSYLNQSSVGEIRVVDGGKYYPEPPSATLSDTYGKDEVITATLDGAPVISDPTNDPLTGIVEWNIAQAPPYKNDQGVDDSLTWYTAFSGSTVLPLTAAASGNGSSTTYTNPNWVIGAQPGGWAESVGGYNDDPASLRYTKVLNFTVTGQAGGVGARVRLVFSGASFAWYIRGEGDGPWDGPGGRSNTQIHRGARTLVSIHVDRYGAGYSDDSTVVITIPAGSGAADKAIILEGFTAGNARNATSPRYSVKTVTIDPAHKGKGYLVAPQIKFSSSSGFGAYATCTVANGHIDTITLENGGGGYKSAPTVTAVSGGAEAFPVARPHLRGKYQCYYRYLDNTPEDAGGPIPSNLSPVTEIDAGEGATSISWSTSAGSARAASTELWRTTGNEALTLYRVSLSASGVDDLTDDELRDANRAGYAAMPIILPNGELNANRFGVPPSDKAVVVRFQDRMWYGVDTGGKEPNSLFFSEVDEPESVPDINELVIQTNAKDSDAVQALIPFGSSLLVMQTSHAFSLTFSRQPLLDASVTPIAYRGALNQRSWDIFGGVCYIIDQYGIYSISPQGQIDDLSAAVADIFRHDVDYSKSTWSFLIIDATNRVVRAFLPFKEDASRGYPTRAMCYSIDSKTWWMERYPQALTTASHAKLSNGDAACVFAGPNGAYLLNADGGDMGVGAVMSVTLTGKGAGYRTPPTVTAAGGCGAEFQASINAEGQLTAIWVLNAGYGYGSGSLAIAAPNDPSHSAPVTATATYTAATGAMYPVYRLKTGAAGYVSDAQDPKAGQGTDRRITLSYQPQPAACEVSLRTYYNNSSSPRPNAARRDRGTGFVHDITDNAARLDMGANTQKYGVDSGVTSVLHVGRTIDDVQSSDRFIAIELVGARKTAAPVVIYALDILGTENK